MSWPKFLSPKKLQKMPKLNWSIAAKKNSLLKGIRVPPDQGFLKNPRGGGVALMGQLEKGAGWTTSPRRNLRNTFSYVREF